MRIAILLLVFVAIAALPGRAQDRPPPANPDDDAGWFSIGLGASDPFDLSGFVGLHFGRERFVQVLATQTSVICFSSTPCSGLGTVGVGLGQSWVDRAGRVAVSAGPFAGVRRWKAGQESHFTAGLYASAQGIVTPLKEFGVGIDLFAQLYHDPAGPDPRFRVARGVRVAFVLEGNK